MCHGEKFLPPLLDSNKRADAAQGGVLSAFCRTDDDTEPRGRIDLKIKAQNPGTVPGDGGTEPADLSIASTRRKVETLFGKKGKAGGQMEADNVTPLPGVL